MKLMSAGQWDKYQFSGVLVANTEPALSALELRSALR